MLLFVMSATDLAHSRNEPVAPGVVDALIQIWYSAFVPTAMLSQLQTLVSPLITQVCNKIADKNSETVWGKTWEFQYGGTLRLVLTKLEWFKLENICKVPARLTRGEAEQIRITVTLAPERADYRDRWYFKDEYPFRRISKQRFREDGLLLHFGHPRRGFNNPNP